MEDSEDERSSRVYHFVCDMDALPKDDVLTRELNAQLRSQLEACEALGGAFLSLTPEAKVAPPRNRGQSTATDGERASG